MSLIDTLPYGESLRGPDASTVGSRIMSTKRPRVLYVTGRLAEPALRRTLVEVAPRLEIEAELAVLPISVAALMTARWVAQQLTLPPGIEKVVLPGLCQGDLGQLAERWGIPVELGPVDLRELGRSSTSPMSEGYGPQGIEILAEINHAPRLGLPEFIVQAERYREQGADRIDVGCDPDGGWGDVGRFVAEWVQGKGGRASIDSFDPREVEGAIRGGADLVLSVNGSNRAAAPDWGVEVVAIPDQPGTLEGLDATIEFLEKHGVRHRIDPILEPIGCGFAASLGRYLEARRRWPEAAILMGVGNLTELTDVDSAGVNALLIGFCQEQAIGSVLTTAVAPWARSSVVEIDLARRLAHYAVARGVPPKRVDPRLVVLRDDRVPEYGPEALAEIAKRVRDPNWRIYAEGGLIHAFNHQNYLTGTDPFLLFSRMGVDDPNHAFYLGHELMKARTALTLHKAYRQDRPLDWGHLTESEADYHRLPRRRVAAERPS